MDKGSYHTPLRRNPVMVPLSSFPRARHPTSTTLVSPPSHPSPSNLNLYAPLNKTKARPGGVPGTPPALHRHRLQLHGCPGSKGSPTVTHKEAVLKGHPLSRAKGTSLEMAEYRSAHLSGESVFFLLFTTNFYIS